MTQSRPLARHDGPIDRPAEPTTAQSELEGRGARTISEALVRVAVPRRPPPPCRRPRPVRRRPTESCHERNERDVRRLPWRRPPHRHLHGVAESSRGFAATGSLAVSTIVEKTRSGIDCVFLHSPRRPSGSVGTKTGGVTGAEMGFYAQVIEPSPVKSILVIPSDERAETRTTCRTLSAQSRGHAHDDCRRSSRGWAETSGSGVSSGPR